MSSSPSPTRFASAHVRAMIVKILLAVGAVATGMSLLVDALSLAFTPLSEGQAVEENPSGAVIILITLLLAITEIIIYLTTVVFFLVWLYRAYANLRAFDQWARTDYSPGLAVGSFFIPFVNLVLPYRVVREVWQKSGPPDERLISAPGPPASFPLWWTFWLLASFAGQASMRATFNENVAESTATQIGMVASVLSILAAVFAYLVVDAIDTRQEETSRILKLGKFTGPPLPPVTNSPASEVMASMPGQYNSQ